MSKSIKLKNETYIDSSSISHERVSQNNFLEDTGWRDLPLVTDASTLEWCKLSYRKIKGIVYINGLFKLNNPTWGKQIGQLPNGCYPSWETDFVCRGVDNSSVVIAIAPNGQINFLDTVNGVYSAEFGGGIISGSFIANN